MSASIYDKETQLRRILDSLPRALIAYSGGVDSAFLLWFATHQSSVQARGILADSESLKRTELNQARTFAQKHHLDIQIIRTRELENPDYAANPLNRCFYCKHALFEKMEALAREDGVDALCYGENADDASQTRPGHDAARKFSILAPLKQAGLDKQEIRALAHTYHLQVAEKKAQPCLASRIEHGLEVTSDRLQTVEQAESYLDDLGFQIVRVRHQGSQAKVQVAPFETHRLLEPETSHRIRKKLTSLGFTSVVLDPVGYHGSGLL